MTPDSLRRFRPRPRWTLAMLIAVALFVIAGNWQRDRMAMKASLRAQFDAWVAARPASLPDPGPGADWSSQRFRPVIVRGEYDAAQQIFIDNRVHGGRAGYEVVTPMKLEDGRLVLVDRGWVAQGPSRAALPDAQPARGIVSVHGRIALPSTRYVELDSSATTGALWQNLDPARFAASTRLPVLPVVVEQTEAPIPDDGLVRDRPPPDFGIDQHRLYMLQWYALAGLALCLWLVLSFRRRIEVQAR